MPYVTLLIAGLHGLLLLALVVPIVKIRRGRKIGLGDGGDAELLRRIRAHANFIEYVPTVLVVLALLELSGGDRRVVAVLGAALLFARIAHAFGLTRSAGYSKGRFTGTLLTWTVVFVASAYAVVLAALHFVVA